METLHQRHKGFSFHGLTQDVTVFVLISVPSPQLSLLLCSPSSAAISNSASSLSPLFGHCIRKEFKVTLKYHASCEVDHTCVWSQSLKKIVAGDSPGILPPFSVAPCPIWSNLAAQERGETVWRWGDANNVAPHLMCLKCLWPLRPALWSATNLMVSYRLCCNLNRRGWWCVSPAFTWSAPLMFETLQCRHACTVLNLSSMFRNCPRWVAEAEELHFCLASCGAVKIPTLT